MIKAAALYWYLSYHCFIFNEEDMVPTIKEYSMLLRIEFFNSNKILYKVSKKSKYRKKLAQIIGLASKPWIKE